MPKSITSFDHPSANLPPHTHTKQAVEDGGFEGTWDQFFEAWCQGEVAFGAWLDHLLSWCGGPAATVRACVRA
jgi:hypothetical protein